MKAGTFFISGQEEGQVMVENKNRRGEEERKSEKEKRKER